MCTSIAFKNSKFLFGRTLDIECGFGEQVIITPSNYPFRFRFEKELNRHFSIIGMAAVSEGYPLYADAANEKGLCMAGLKFPDNAFYPDTTSTSKHNISPFELIPWILSQCSSTDEAESLLSRTHLTAIPFSNDLPLAPLHWHIADSRRSIVLESTANGMKIYDNPHDVLTNNPPFDFHLTNLNQYLNLTSKFPQNRFGAELEPFSNSFGTIGLPGDFSSCSRFIRAAFLRANSICTENEEISCFFHILENVSLPKGCVYTKENLPDFTLYSCCIDADKGIYYYKNYSNSRVTAVSLKNKDEKELICFPLKIKEDIYFAN